MKPLFFSPSPRDVPQYREAIDKLKIDKLLIKYHKAKEAYPLARQWFLERDYTHLIICPDDLIVTEYDIYRLLEDTKYYGVVSGWCINTILDNWEELQDSGLSTSLPKDPPHQSKYEDYNFIPANKIEQDKIIEVKFAGFVLQCTPREIVEKIPFRTSEGCCADACFALDLNKAGIPQYVDTRVKTLHLKIPFSQIQVGKKEKEIRFEPAI